MISDSSFRGKPEPSVWHRTASKQHQYLYSSQQHQVFTKLSLSLTQPKYCTGTILLNFWVQMRTCKHNMAPGICEVFLLILIPVSEKYLNRPISHPGTHPRKLLRGSGLWRWRRRRAWSSCRARPDLSRKPEHPRDGFVLGRGRWGRCLGRRWCEASRTWKSFIKST